MAADKPITTRRFYTDALLAAEQAELPAALEMGGIDEEIAVLRLLLRTRLEEHPEDLPLMFKGLDLLTAMVVKRYRLPATDERDLSRRLGELRDELMDVLAVEKAS